MFNRLLSYFLTFALVLTCISWPVEVNAEDTTETIDGVTYTITAEGMITSISQDATVVNIPESIGGIDVHQISKKVFYDNYTIEKLYIPACVICEESWDYFSKTDFWWMSLYDCYNLEELIVDSGNKSVKMVDGVLYSYDGTHLLYYPSYLTATSYTIEDGTTDIWQCAIFNNDYLKEIKLPDSLVKIRDRSIQHLKSLESVVFATSLEVIDEWNFTDCESLKSFAFPEGITTIGTGLLYWCSSLETITIPESLTNILYLHTFTTCALARECCNNLKQYIVDSENPVFKSVDGCLMSKDGTEFMMYPQGKQETSFTVPYGVEVLYKNCFGESSIALKNIVLPDSMTTITDSTISSICNLDSVTIPNSVTSIEGELLKNSPNAVIKCGENSYARQYAIDNGYTYELVESDKKQQHITGVEDYVKYLSDSSFVITPVNDGDGALSYETDSSCVSLTQTDEGVRVDLVSAGIATITIKASGTAEYVSAEKKVKVTVKKNIQEIICDDDIEKTYGDSDFKLQLQVNGLLEDEWKISEEPVEAGEDTEVREQKVYRYKKKSYIYSGEESLDGYTKEATKYYNFSTGKWQNGVYTDVEGYGLKVPVKSTKVRDEYAEIRSYNETRAYKSWVYTTDDKDWFWSNTSAINYGGQYTTNLLEIYSSKQVSDVLTADSDNSYELAKEISVGNDSDLGEVYLINYNSEPVNSWTSGARCMYVWNSSSNPYTLYQPTTQRIRYVYSKWSDWSEWSDTAVDEKSGRMVESKTVYEYRNKDTEDTVHLSYSVDGDSISIDEDGTISLLKSGVSEVTVTAEENDRYQSASKTIMIKVDKAEQSIECDDTFNMTFGDSSFNLGVKTFGNGELSYSTDSDCISVSDEGKVTINSAGTAKVTVKLSETDRYSECTKEITVNINGHTHKAMEAAKENYVESGCETAGSYDLVVRCAECGEKLDSEHHEIEALGHDIVTDKAVSATYVSTGLTEGCHCSRCGKVITAQKTIPRLKLSKVSNVSANLKTYRSVKVKWSKVKGASGYYVMYRKGSSGSWTVKKTTKLYYNTANLKSGYSYQFKVRAYAKNGKGVIVNKGEVSTVKTCRTLKKMYTPKVKKLSSSRVKVHWSELTGATGYQISVTAKSNNKVTTKRVTKEYITLSPLTVGNKYSFKVRAYKTVDGKKIYGPWSDSKVYTHK